MHGSPRPRRRNNMWKKIKKKLWKQRSGELSIAYAVVTLIGVMVFSMAFIEYNNYMIVRHIEAVSDLAAVEAVRKYVDEEELRNERLVIKPENIPRIRDTYLEKVRENLPSRVADILRIEIPSIEDGVIEISDNYLTDVFPNSTSEAFVDMGDQQNRTQQWFVLDGTTPGDAAAAVVRDTSNINTAAKKQKTSYIFTVKLTVIYKTMPMFSRPGGNILNFVDIFTNTPVTIVTTKNDPTVNCITIESQGKVTLR